MIILDDILNELASAFVSYASDKLKEEVALLVGVPKEIEKLKEHFVMINAVLADAEQRELEDEERIKNWLDKLRDIVYDIEDVLEDMQGVPKNEVKPGDNEEEEKKKVCFPSCIPTPRFRFKKIKEVKARHDIARRMEEINDRLDLIAKLKDEYKLEVVGGIDETRNERRMTTAFGQFLPNLAAQTAIRNQVAEKLRGNQDGKNMHVISLVGMGGIGKTTIARMVFNDEAIRAQFDKLIWVCISDHFSEMKVAKAIAQDIVDDKKGVAELNELQQVLKQINESIRAKKFFLVLDDVWTDSNENWDGIFSCLGACLSGSKVLVTTRSHRVALKMKTDFKVPVNQLKDEECLLLFRHFAFYGRAEGECRSLESIAEEMAKRCKGLPLTAETLGKAMAYKSTREEWNAVLGSKLWDFEDVKKGLLPALSISYIDLPSPIKRCFSYCSIFQKDEVIEKGDLIRIWMGLGFLSSEAEGSRKMEAVGEEYLNSLVARSFFQVCKTTYYPLKEAVKMHDIIHDFAQYLTKNESLVFLGDGGGSRKIRHLNVPSRQAQAQLSTLSINMECLRTLLLGSGDSSDVLLKLSRARILKLKGSMIRMIPSEIGKLTHLRYIDFSDCYLLKELPESICDLSALQTLDIHHCNLVKLPKGIGKLIDLRHLDASYCQELKELPESICDLSALQTLGIRLCRKLEKLPQGIGKLIGLRHLDATECAELKELPESICDLSALETLVIRFCSKLEKLPEGIGKLIHLRNLDTSFCYELKELPESFCDLSALEKLDIYNCSKLEKLLERIGKLIHLRHLNAKVCGELKELSESICNLSALQVLYIRYCKKLEKLPPLGRLPLLESLEIGYSPGVRNVGKELLGIIEEAEGVGHEEDYQPTLTSNSFVAFPKLRQLTFYRLYEWTTWADPEHDNNIQFTIMPSLLYLRIVDCPKLQALPRFLAGALINKLEIKHCLLIEKSIKEGCEGYRWVSDIPKCDDFWGPFGNHFRGE